MRWYEIEKLIETSSAGTTSASNIAVLPSTKIMSKNTLGADFNQNRDCGIYSTIFKKVSNSNLDVIRR